MKDFRSIFLSDEKFHTIVLKGRSFRVSDYVFENLKKHRKISIEDESERPYDFKRQMRVHPLAEKGIQLDEGGRVLAQEIVYFSPVSDGFYYLVEVLGENWYEWEYE